MRMGRANSEVFDELMARGGIRIKRAPLFDVSLTPKPRDFDFSKIEGMLLGLAIGDALGNPTESLRPDQRAAFGEIRNYVEPAGIGLPSDDTQLAFWTLEQMISDRGYVPENVAGAFCNRRIIGQGMTVLEFVQNFQEGMPWWECGPASAGNGALMRIAPMVVPHLRSGGTDLWIDTALCAMTTHNDSASTAACLSFVAMLWDLLDMTAPPKPNWWLDQYVQRARELETGADYSARGGAFTDYEGPAWRFVDEKVQWASERNLPVREACQSMALRRVPAGDDPLRPIYIDAPRRQP